MSEEVSGKGAAVVVRDRKTGKCRNLEEEARQKQEEDEKMAQHKEKYAKFGKGYVHSYKPVVSVVCGLRCIFMILK
jgi:hypothetical protein